MAIINKYVFCVGTRNITTVNYLCSNRTSYRCRARATFSKENKYLRGQLQHNHPMPHYYILNGVLHKEKLSKKLQHVLQSSGTLPQALCSVWITLCSTVQCRCQRGRVQSLQLAFYPVVQSRPSSVNCKMSLKKVSEVWPTLLFMPIHTEKILTGQFFICTNKLIIQYASN